ncbi:ADP-ribose glycohydrolase MACROD2 [Chanos chanos]|uniref:ADP-ribose glycohydrolase MACROD2 n=1 Tax=Chanos chanos TaxID=29144 RepID=A0A6J2V340_CHACN|nr:ADP-ribose glycohydrolase MACROD2 [Chanos chanos]
MSKKKKEWRAEKERLLSLGLEERRKEYRGSYITLDNIPTWRKHDKSAAKEEEEEPSVFLSDKVSLFKGDITTLEVDAIVNAANSSLLGGGGVDGCIHRAAGHFLYEECLSLNGCDTGKAKITCGYDLPAKYVIHTVGPIARGNVGPSQKTDLESCYKYSLELLKENGLRSVAFPCISTGIYGFPNEPAAEIALKTVRNWLKKNKAEIDRVIFCVFLEMDHKIYKDKMSRVFSADNEVEKSESAQEEGNTPPSKKSKSKSKDGEEDADEEQEEEEEEEGKGEKETEVTPVENQKDPAGPEPGGSSEEKETTDRGSATEEKKKKVPENQPEEQEEKKEGEKEGSEEPPAETAPSLNTPSPKDPAAPEKEEDKNSVDPEKFKDGSQPPEPMEMEGDVGESPSTEAKKTDTSNNDVEMESQNLDSQEAEPVQADSSQSKDDSVEQMDTRKE